jgi:hypothetical protein
MDKEALGLKVTNRNFFIFNLTLVTISYLYR